jgi:hypothetical protein
MATTAPSSHAHEASALALSAHRAAYAALGDAEASLTSARTWYDKQADRVSTAYARERDGVAAEIATVEANIASFVRAPRHKNSGITPEYWLGRLARLVERRKALDGDVEALARAEDARFASAERRLLSMYDARERAARTHVDALAALHAQRRVCEEASARCAPTGGTNTCGDGVRVLLGGALAVRL